MTRLALLAATAALAAGLAAPAAANPSPIEPCHGSTYEHGALIWLPGEDRPIRACIEQ
jgi:hypothetical protein